MNHVKDAATDAAQKPGTLVEGYVVEHEMRWHSMPEYLNIGFGGTEKAADSAELRDAAAIEHRRGRAVNAPKVSVTLSDYLSADYSQSPDDPSCDFGWFTPTASGGSIDDLLSCGDHNHCSGSDFYLDVRDASPSPSYTIPSFLFSKFGSTSKTATLSPDSATGLPSREPGSREGLSHLHLHSQQQNKHYYPLRTDAPNGHPQRQPQQQQAKQQQQQQDNPRRQNAVLGSALLHSIASNSSDGATGSSNSRSTANGSGLGLHGAGAAPRRTAANRMPEINQWHSLHRHVSRTGRLSASAASGNCTMHLRRTSFPISTRHFPEKPPTPKLAQSLSGGGAGSSRTSGGGGFGGRRVNGLGQPGRQNSSTGVGSPRVGEAALQAAGLVGAGEGKTASGQQQAQEDAGGEGGEGKLARLCEEVGRQPQLRKVKPKSYAWALTEIRVVKPRGFGVPPHAEYLVVACLGRQKLVAGWRRASDFGRLAAAARRAWMSKVRAGVSQGRRTTHFYC